MENKNVKELSREELLKVVKILTAVENSVEKVERLNFFNNHIKSKNGGKMVLICEIVE